MTLSLNEVEAMARKAARGAGYSWGLAEEAGKATRWLCAQGLDGCGALAEVLTRFDSGDARDRSPRIQSTGWLQGDGAMCPLTTGAALSDRASKVAVARIRIGAVAGPLLLLPFAALAARKTGRVLTITCPGMTAVTDGVALSMSGAGDIEEAETVIVSVGGDLDAAYPTRTRADPDRNAWCVLERLAARTYAPATAESRLKGAGAGLSDND